jgi:hypothetical protein
VTHCFGVAVTNSSHASGIIRSCSNGFQRELVAREIVLQVEDRPMRKVLSLLDEEQREALSELLDFGTAVFSAGLVVAVLKGFVDLLT